MKTSNGMNEQEFKKGIGEMREMGMTDAEKKSMLKSIFGAPVESPYVRFFNVSIFGSRQAAALAFSLVLVLGTASASYASERALPGDVLYSIKTEVFEPLIGKFKLKPENQLAWEAEKIERRIKEAEKLVAHNKLDEEKVKGLEKKIEKSSATFAAVAEKTASSTATTTEGRREKVEKFKSDLVNKIGEKKEEKVKRLKNAAVKGLEKSEDKEGKK